jgi:hypothetical protein
MFTEYSGIKKKKKGFKQTKNNIDWSEYASTLVKSMDESDYSVPPQSKNRHTNL